MSARPGWSYRAGDWFGVFGEQTTVALPPSERSRAARAWELVDAGADFAGVLDELVAGGLGSLPGFVLVGVVDGDTVVLVRGGEARVHVTGADREEQVTAGAAATWVERRFGDVRCLRIETDALPDAAPGSHVGVVDAGLVRFGSAEHPARVEDLPEEVDHDGLTHQSEPTGVLHPFPGIPGQPPAPPVTARPVARLVFSHGDEVAVDRAVLVGRAPEAGRASAGEPHLVAVPSPNQEISSTHLEVRPGSGADHGAAVVTDLGSTNGTVLRQPGLPAEDLRPGVAVQLVPGAVVDLGDGVTITVVDA